MHALVTRATVSDFEEAQRFLREEGIPQIKQVPGFVNGYWMRLDGEDAAGLILFESEEAARGAAERIRDNPPGGPTVEMTTVEIGEVVGQAA